MGDFNFNIEASADINRGHEEVNWHIYPTYKARFTTGRKCREHPVDFILLADSGQQLDEGLTVKPFSPCPITRTVEGNKVYYSLSNAAGLLGDDIKFSSSDQPWRTIRNRATISVTIAGMKSKKR